MEIAILILLFLAWQSSQHDVAPPSYYAPPPDVGMMVPPPPSDATLIAAVAHVPTNQLPPQFGGFQRGVGGAGVGIAEVIPGPPPPPPPAPTPLAPTAPFKLAPKFGGLQSSSTLAKRLN